MKKRMVPTVVLLLAMVASVQAGMTVNLDSYDAGTVDNKPTSVSLNLVAGDYSITPIAAKYEAWNAWSKVDLANGRGWLHRYSYEIDSVVTDVDSPGVYATATEALNNAVTANFTLANDSIVKFYITDWPYKDNQGGVSLMVKNLAIPAPGAILLGSLGTGLVTWMRRRRSL